MAIWERSVNLIEMWAEFYPDVNAEYDQIPWSITQIGANVSEEN